jgi:hypothetical protein
MQSPALHRSQYGVKQGERHGGYQVGDQDRPDDRPHRHMNESSLFLRSALSGTLAPLLIRINMRRHGGRTRRRRLHGLRCGLRRHLQFSPYVHHGIRNAPYHPKPEAAEVKP